MTPILLISDQTLPNLLFLKQFGPFDRVVFVSTERMAKAGHPVWIAGAAGLDRKQVLEVNVDPDRPESTLQALNSLDLPQEEEVVGFITGGTKMMSLAAYAWCSQRTRARVLYLPFGGPNFLQIFPESAEVPLTVEASLTEYLAVHGVKVVQQGAWQPWENESHRVFDHFSGKKQDSEVGSRVKASKRPNEFPKVAHLLTPEERAFYSGAWFEVWMVSKVRSLLSVPEANICQGLKLNKSGVKDNNPYSNEYDAAFVFQNRLYLGECKFYSEGKSKALSVIRGDLFKLANANNLLGLNAKPFFSVVQFVNGNPEPFVSEVHKPNWDELSRILRIPEPIEWATLLDDHAFRAYFLRTLR